MQILHSRRLYGLEQNYFCKKVQTLYQTQISSPKPFFSADIDHYNLKYETNLNFTDNFVCTQNDYTEIFLLVLSILIKCIDHMISGYLFLLSTGRGILKIHHDHSCLQVTTRLLALTLTFFLYFIATPLIFVVPSSANLIRLTLPYFDFNQSVYIDTWLIRILNSQVFYSGSLILGYVILGIWACIGVVLILFIA